jgi:hypothetical protein
MVYRRKIMQADEIERKSHEHGLIVEENASQ